MSAPEPATPPHDEHRTARILIVEDDPVARRALREILLSRGYQPVEAVTGEEALGRITDVELVLLDGMLPGWDGWSTCERIKSLRPELPVIMVTARTEQAAIVRTYEAGADDYIAKPFRSVELLARIESRIRVRQSERKRLSAEARLKHLVSSAPAVIFSCEPEPPYPLTFISENVQSLLGFPAERFLESQEFWLSRLHPDDLEGVRAALTQAAERGHHVFEYRFLHSDGSFRWILDETTGVRDDNGQVVEIIGAISDITERRRLQVALETRTRQQHVLAELGQLALAGVDVQRLMELAVSQLVRTLDVEFAKVLELMPDRRSFQVRASRGWPEGYATQARADRDTESQAAYTLRAGASVIVENLRSETRFAGRDRVLALGAASSMSTAIQTPDGPFGVLGVHSTRERMFTGDDVHFLQGIAHVLGEAIQRSRSEESLRRYAAQLRGLADASLEIHSAHTAEDILQTVVERARQILGARSAVATLSPTRSGEPSLQVTSPPDGGEDDDMAPAPAAGQVLEATLPARSGQELGRIRLHGPLHPGFAGSDETILVQLARIASVALENARLLTDVQATEERYRQFFEDDLTGDYVCSPDGRLVECNRAFAAIFGFRSVDEALRTDLPHLYPSGDTHGEIVNRLRRERRLELHEVEMRRVDGTPVHVIQNAIGIFDGAGELVHVKGYMFDVTERRALEIQLLQAQKMEAVGKLAGGIAHDFNNLLTVIRGNVALRLMELGPHDDERDYLGEIDDASARAADLTRQLLAFSRRQVLQPRLLNLNTTIRELNRMVVRVIGEDIEVVTALDPALAWVQVDPGQIEQVIMNLAVNARDAMPRGGRLTVETANTELTDDDVRRYGSYVVPGPYVMLAVSDTGVGMSAEVRAHVFEPFFTTKEPGRGTGLGLSTVYGIVKQSDGFIWFDSEPDRGTRFRIYLPRATSAAAAADAAMATDRAVAAGSETILLVEDEASVRSLARRALERAGYRVVETADATRAIETFRERPQDFDLVLTDVVMPRISGPEMVEKLISIRAGLKVVYMSGYTDEAVLHLDGVTSGLAFVQKPFTPRQLAQRVRQVLDGGRSE